MPFRLRSVLLLGILATAIAWGVPRVRAIFRFHTQVTAYADYALCLLGPTGPEILRQGGGDGAQLLRARLVSASPAERPFAECRKLGDSLELRSAALLSEPASIFREYFDEDRGGVSLSELEISIAPLTELLDQAFPFGPDDARPLIIPSRHAKEAPHPGALPAPALGSGLRGDLGPLRSSAAYGDVLYLTTGSGVNQTSYVSVNRGLTFRRARRDAGAMGDRLGDEPSGHSFSLVLSERNEWLALSHEVDRTVHVATLGPLDERLLAVDCDEKHLLALSEAQAGGQVVLHLCDFGGACRALVPPRLGNRAFSGRVDGALLDGDLVLSLATGGLTRVTSSRDGGLSWTPWVLAFDEQGCSARFSSRPDRLVRVGDDLLLLGGSASDGTEAYPVLLSTDHGASFFPPEASRWPEDARADASL